MSFSCIGKTNVKKKNTVYKFVDHNFVYQCFLYIYLHPKTTVYGNYE
jgi:hypothetical protein